jgi:predicted LPLAT superfamily acyltransferase
MAEVWVKQRERGSAPLIRLIAFLSLRMGRQVGRALLYPICLYFLAFAPTARRASRAYLALALERPPTLWNVFRHLHVHASVLLDRVFTMAGGTQKFNLRIHGLDIIEDHVRSKRGCILISGHIGSFDMLRSLAEEHAVAVKVMMYTNMSRKFNAVLEMLNPDLAKTIIPLGLPTSLIAAGQFIRQGGMVGILGDRLVGEEKAVDAPFFGRLARFPVGPLLLSTALQVPIVFVVSLYEGRRRYAVHFEDLSEPSGERSRELTDANMREWAGRYAQRLEHYCRKSPYNWFNFYNFWAHQVPGQ